MLISLLAGGLLLITGAPAHAATRSFTCQLSPVLMVNCGADAGLTVSSTNGGHIYIRVTEKKYSEVIGAIAIDCNGRDLGAWVTPMVVGTLYRLTNNGPVAPGTCFKIKWGRSWAFSVSGQLTY